jgi:polyisoprenoid-binding protein YceI
MSQVATQPFSGTYRAQPAPSTFASAVGHSGAFWFRGLLSDVDATPRADDDGVVLGGSANVESISVVEPAAMRASVLGSRFFDAGQHPKITFRSTEVRLDDDGRVELRADRRYRPLRGAVTGRLRRDRRPGTADTIDRRDFGFDWQMQLPDGGDAVSWDVWIDIDLLLMREDANADG